MKLTLDKALQKGTEAQKAGRVKEAKGYFISILKDDPKHPDVNHKMGLLAIGVGEVKQALPFFETALEIDPQRAQFWISYIDALIKLNRNEDARSLLNEVKSNGLEDEGFNKLDAELSRVTQGGDHGLCNTLFDKATQLREKGEFTQAINILKDGLSRFPKNSNFLAFLSLCYILNDQLEDAVVQLDKAKEVDPDNATVSWNEVRLLLKKNNVSEALTLARKANERFPDDIEGMGILGSCLRANGNISESLKFLNKAIEQNDNYAEAFINRGLIRLTLKDKHNALEDLERAHQLKPYIKQIWNLLIKLKIEFKHFEDTILIINKILEIDPKNADSFASMALCHQNLYEFEAAISAYNKAISLRPNFFEAYYNLGVAFRDKGELDKALAACSKAISIKPDYAAAYNNMGIILKDLGKFEEATEAYNKAISIKPDYAEAYFNIANIFKDLGKFEEATEAYKKAISIKPDYAAAYNNMGIILKDLGKFEEATEAYNKAISINPDYAEAYTNAVEILKTSDPKIKKSHSLFDADKQIKQIGVELIEASLDQEIINIMLKALNCLGTTGSCHKTSLSQIYKHTGEDLNCIRHMSIFNEKRIIPEFCFGCIKVQVEVDTFIDLIKLTSLFYKLDLNENLITKTMIELRPKVSGFYKGFIYCRGLKQAQNVKNLLDVHLRNLFKDRVHSKIKRGCTEYSWQFPKYGELPGGFETMSEYPKEWKSVEDAYDKNMFTESKKNIVPSINGFCLSDFYIIQNWIDYAKGLDDHSCESFKDVPIAYEETYKAAVLRKTKFNNIFS